MPSETAVDSPPAPVDPEATLRRILAAVEKTPQRGRLELAIAVILSLATLASTWCGYQSKQWGGVQGSKQAAADTAERQAAEDTIVGLQLRTFDGIELLSYWSALRQKDTQTMETIIARMRPALRKAVEASIAAGVLTNPEVAGPLKRPEYVLAEEQDARRLRDEAVQLNSDARKAGETAGEYVVLTLMFASVLFFGGITGTFTAKRVRIGLAWVALALFIFTTVVLAGLPMCRG